MGLGPEQIPIFGIWLKGQIPGLFFFFLLSLTSFQKWNTCIHRVLLTATSSVPGLPSRILCFLLYMKNVWNNINSTVRPLCTYLQFFKMQVSMQINGNWLLVIMDKQGTKKKQQIIYIAHQTTFSSQLKGSQSVSWSALLSLLSPPSQKSWYDCFQRHMCVSSTNYPTS